MKKLARISPAVRRWITGLLPAIILLAGCESARRIIWSPDASHAVLLSGKDFYLCDRAGNLSGVLFSNVTDAAWFSDSQRLALVQQQVRTNWKVLAIDLPAATREAVRKCSDVLLTSLQSGTARDKLGNGLEKDQQALVDAGLLYLRDERPEETRKALMNTTNKLENATATLYCLRLAHLAGDTMEADAVLAYSLQESGEIRISPDDKFIAFAARPPGQLNLVAADGKQPVRMVDKIAGPGIDWSPDSRSLVYLRPEGSDPEQTLVCSLVRRRVVNEAGRIDVADNSDELAGLANDLHGRVRWLQNGQILFAATAIQLPATAKDMPQRQLLFAVDPERQATITSLVPRGNQEQLPENLGSFELSPDEKRVLIAGDKSKVVVFAIVSGEVTVIQPDTDTDTKLLPVWRGTNEVCYAAFSEPDKEGKRKIEVSLWQQDRTNALSIHWPATVRTNWLN